MTFGKFIAVIIQNYTLLETSIGAVTWLKTFSESTPIEDPSGEHTGPPSSWPDRGVINTADREKGGVLILDDFSSSLDVDTDKLMQEIVLHEFGGYTIIMVSHRLEMTMRSTKSLSWTNGL
ncbi:uncharacterized protein G6M90_00g052620 [Metarhizium brunneum]|uniref:Uncharacterized protein n=1 Tax=Metarhizium brunneum TaxID=500148 RepID=A0A7D5UWR9_9HYPO